MWSGICSRNLLAARQRHNLYKAGLAALARSKMSLSTRVSLQWPPNAPEELSNTLVMSSESGHFVDIRIFRQFYPLGETDVSRPFDEVFQWCMSGIENPLDGGTIEFKKELDSAAVSEALQAGKQPESLLGRPDIGHFSEIEGSQNRKETGSMVNPDSGKEEDYIEVWKSLDPVEHTFNMEVREKKPFIHKAIVLKVSDAVFEGKLMQLGNWKQGLLYTRLTCTFSVIRSYHDKEWKDLIKYGANSFPRELACKAGEVLEHDGVKWECLEA